MNTKHRFITLLSSVTVVACCCGSAASGAPAQKYSLTDIGVLPDQQSSSPAAINDQGEVAGTSGLFAFLYIGASKLEDIATVPSQSDKDISRGFGINAAGIVVGDSTFGHDFSHAAVFSNGSVIDLGTLKEAGKFSRANGINAYGQVVGFASGQRDLPSGRAFVTSIFGPSNMSDLGTLGGVSAQAWGINDTGVVTGNSQIGNDLLGPTHAFIWARNTGMRDLGTLAGNFSYGTFINGKNHVVGYSTITMNNDRVHAFLHDGNQMIDLGSLGGPPVESDNSYALGVNASDQVVGYTYLPSLCPGCERTTGVNPSLHSPLPVAFIYRDGLMTNLNDLIEKDTGANYQVASATAINDEGLIAAMAYENFGGALHAVLLTPLSH